MITLAVYAHLLNQERHAGRTRTAMEERFGTVFAAPAAGEVVQFGGQE